MDSIVTVTQIRFQDFVKAYNKATADYEQTKNTPLLFGDNTEHQTFLTIFENEFKNAREQLSKKSSARNPCSFRIEYLESYRENRYIIIFFNSIHNSDFFQKKLPLIIAMGS